MHAYKNLVVKLFKISKFLNILQFVIFIFYVTALYLTMAVPFEYYVLMNSVFMFIANYLTFPDLVLWLIGFVYIVTLLLKKFIYKEKATIFEWVLLALTLPQVLYIPYGHLTGELGRYM